MRLTPNDPIDPDAGWPGPDIADPWGQPSSRRDHWKRTFLGFFYASALLVGFGLYFIDKNPDGSGRFSGYLIGGGLACLGAGLATMRWVGKERRSGRWG